jgi:hypothetical protein
MQEDQVIGVTHMLMWMAVQLLLWCLQVQTQGWQ